MFVGATVCTVLHPGWILTSWPALSSTGLRGSCHAWWQHHGHEHFEETPSQKAECAMQLHYNAITGHECIQIPAYWSGNKLPKL